MDLKWHFCHTRGFAIGVVHYRTLPGWCEEKGRRKTQHLGCEKLLSVVHIGNFGDTLDARKRIGIGIDYWLVCCICICYDRKVHHGYAVCMVRDIVLGIADIQGMILIPSNCFIWLVIFLIIGLTNNQFVWMPVTKCVYFVRSLLYHELYERFLEAYKFTYWGTGSVGAEPVYLDLFRLTVSQDIIRS